MRGRIRGVLAVMLFLFAGMQLLTAGTGPAAAKFGPKWKDLIGEWKGLNQSGAPSGACGFQFDLSQHIIVRKNHAELSASAAAHHDLMIIAPEPAPDKARAIYFDNEGHTIDYMAEWSADGNTLTFTSKPAPCPQFRLIYKKAGSDSFTVSFEMAAPGQPGVFKPYTSGKILRSK